MISDKTLKNIHENEKFIVSWWCAAEALLFIFISIFYSEMLLGNTRVRRSCCSLLFYFWMAAKWEDRKRTRDRLELAAKRNFESALVSSLSYRTLSICSDCDLMKYSTTFPASSYKFRHYEKHNNCWLPHLKERIYSLINKRTSRDAHFHNKQSLDNCFSHVMREKFPPRDLRLAVALLPMEPKWGTKNFFFSKILFISHCNNNKWRESKNISGSW